VKYIPHIALVLCFIAVGVSAQPPVEEAPRPEVYLAKDDGNGNAGDLATEFIATDVPIHCVVRLDDVSPATVKMRLVAVNVEGLRPEMQVVTAIYTTAEGQNEVWFNGRPEKVWFPGMYRADIHVNGKPYRSVEFTVKSGRRAPKPTGSTTVKPRPPATPRTLKKGS
jgi:hypothetical protein